MCIISNWKQLICNIQFVNAENRLKGAVIRVGQEWTDPPNFTGHQQCSSAVSKEEANSGESLTRSCNPRPVGRYVSVQLVGRTERLQLCEVLVYGVAAQGKVRNKELN